MRTLRPRFYVLLLAIALSLAACGGTAASTGSDLAAPTSAAASGAATSATTAPTPTTVSAPATSAPTPTTPASTPTTAPSPTAATGIASATVAGTPSGPAATAAASGTATTTGAAATGSTMSFKADIQPIFNASCTPCHITRKTAGLGLSNYNDVTAGGNDGVVVKPGDASGSLLVQKIKGTQSIGVRMPYGRSPLPADQIQRISDWVAQGAKNN